MNTVLIYPQLEFMGTQLATPPYSILFIADYLRKRNIDVKTLDLRFDKINRVLSIIYETAPEYIGISVMTGPQIYHALKISKIIKKEFKDIKIVWGGVHPTILPGQTLQNQLIDFVIRGEGEFSYFELVSGKKKSQINGLSYKKNNKIIHNPNRELLDSAELNKLCIPWDLVNPMRYIKNNTLNLITSRGCPFKCSFCYNTFLNNYWRGWTAEKCIQEFNRVLNFDIQKINFYDDNFFANSERIKILFKYFKNKSLEWKAELRVDKLTYSLAKEAKKHGCSQMFFGVESGSQKILNILNKKISLEDIIRSAKITKDINIIADYSWMIGIPDETKEDLQKTITLIKKIKKINPDCDFSIKILFPYPKTLIYERAIKSGFKPPTNLYSWSKIRRQRAPNYLKHRNQLEMITLISSIVGKKIFTQKKIPIFKLIRSPAYLRWKKEIFRAGYENVFFKLSQKFFEKIISKHDSNHYDPFSRKIISTRNN